MAQGEKKTSFAVGEPGLPLWLGHGGLVNREEVSFCAGFRTAAMTRSATGWETGVGKAPRHEIAGDWGTIGAAGSMGI